MGMTEGDDENDNDKNNVNYKDNYIYFASSSSSSFCNHGDDNNDDFDADNDNGIDIDDEKFEKAIGMLRMRSVRLDVLIHLLESNIAFEEKKIQEEQDEQKKGSVITGKMNGESEGGKPHQSNSDSDSDDEKMDNETKYLSSSSSSRYLMILLREIRVFGTKASL